MYVQIAEAHASDEWDIGARFGLPDIRQTHTVKLRTEAAKDAQNFFGLSRESGDQVWLDDPQTNLFERTFQAWPTRWFVMQNARVLFAASQKAGMFDLKHTDAFFTR